MSDVNTVVLTTRGGAKKEVQILRVLRPDRALVWWPLAGVYEIALDTGLLRLSTGAGYQLWYLDEAEAARLRAWPPPVLEIKPGTVKPRGPGDIEFVRAHGDCQGEHGGHKYRNHPFDGAILDQENLPFLHVLCDGTRVKL